MLLQRLISSVYPLSHNMRFPIMWYVRPAKAQTSRRIRAVWSEPLLVTWIVYDCEASDRTSFGVSKLKRRLRRLVWVYTCRNATMLKSHVAELSWTKDIYCFNSYSVFCFKISFLFDRLNFFSDFLVIIFFLVYKRKNVPSRVPFFSFIFRISSSCELQCIYFL